MAISSPASLFIKLDLPAFVFSGNHDVQSLPEHRALARRRGNRLHFAEHGGKPLAQRLVRQKIDLLVGKVDGGLDVGSKPRDLRLQSGDARGEFPLHRAHRGARGGRGAGIDEIGDRFGLGDVDLAVEKCPFAELAGPRHAAAKFEEPLQHQVEHQCAAVALKLQDVFAGERGGRRKIQGQALVQAPALRVEKARQPRMPWRRKLTQNIGRYARHQ